MGMNFPSLADQKADLRKRCYAERIAIHGDAAEAAARAVADQVLEHIENRPGLIISAYWPLPGELDPRPALLAAIKRGATGVLPRTSGPDRPLDFHVWQPGDPLIEGRFKVMEPDPASPAASPNVLLVPLLAFDRGRQRLGHGKGYYDRTLQGLKANDPGVRAIGVAFAAQEVDAVPIDAFDQTLDMVITEKAVYKAA